MDLNSTIRLAIAAAFLAEVIMYLSSSSVIGQIIMYLSSSSVIVGQIELV